MTDSTSTTTTDTQVRLDTATLIGIRDSAPDRYRGIALNVVLDQDGIALAIFDGNGRVYWINARITVHTVDSGAFPVADSDVVAAIAAARQAADR